MTLGISSILRNGIKTPVHSLRNRRKTELRAGNVINFVRMKSKRHLNRQKEPNTSSKELLRIDGLSEEYWSVHFARWANWIGCCRMGKVLGIAETGFDCDGSRRRASRSGFRGLLIPLVTVVHGRREERLWHSHSEPEKVQLLPRMLSQEDLEIQHRAQKWTA
jgi:hypothetical protein